jgi:hypothetical protein
MSKTAARGEESRVVLDRTTPGPEEILRQFRVIGNTPAQPEVVAAHAW